MNFEQFAPFQQQDHSFDSNEDKPQQSFIDPTLIRLYESLQYYLSVLLREETFFNATKSELEHFLGAFFSLCCNIHSNIGPDRTHNADGGNTQDLRPKKSSEDSSSSHTVSILRTLTNILSTVHYESITAQTTLSTTVHSFYNGHNESNSLFEQMTQLLPPPSPHLSHKFIFLIQNTPIMSMITNVLFQVYGIKFTALYCDPLQTPRGREKQYWFRFFYYNNNNLPNYLEPFRQMIQSRASEEIGSGITYAALSNGFRFHLAEKWLLNLVKSITSPIISHANSTKLFSQYEFLEQDNNNDFHHFDKNLNFLKYFSTQFGISKLLFWRIASGGLPRLEEESTHFLNTLLQYIYSLFLLVKHSQTLISKKSATTATTTTATTTTATTTTTTATTTTATTTTTTTTTTNPEDQSKTAKKTAEAGLLYYESLHFLLLGFAAHEFELNDHVHTSNSLDLRPYYLVLFKNNPLLKWVPKSDFLNAVWDCLESPSGLKLWTSSKERLDYLQSRKCLPRHGCVKANGLLENTYEYDAERVSSARIGDDDDDDHDVGSVGFNYDCDGDGDGDGDDDDDDMSSLDFDDDFGAHFDDDVGGDDPFEPAIVDDSCGSSVGSEDNNHVGDVDDNSDGIKPHLPQDKFLFATTFQEVMMQYMIEKYIDALLDDQFPDMDQCIAVLSEADQKGAEKTNKTPSTEAIYPTMPHLSFLHLNFLDNEHGVPNSNTQGPQNTINPALYNNINATSYQQYSPHEPIPQAARPVLQLGSHRAVSNPAELAFGHGNGDPVESEAEIVDVDTVSIESVSSEPDGNVSDDEDMDGDNQEEFLGDQPYQHDEINVSTCLHSTDERFVAISNLKSDIENIAFNIAQDDINDKLNRLERIFLVRLLEHKMAEKGNGEAEKVVLKQEYLAQSDSQLDSLEFFWSYRLPASLKSSIKMLRIQDEKNKMGEITIPMTSNTKTALGLANFMLYFLPQDALLNGEMVEMVENDQDFNAPQSNGAALPRTSKSVSNNDV